VTFPRAATRDLPSVDHAKLLMSTDAKCVSCFAGVVPVLITVVRNKCVRARIASAPPPTFGIRIDVTIFYAALPYLIDFEAGRSFREAQGRRTLERAQEVTVWGIQPP
jgi:hypothetical protein